jgi:hypothetical protein
MGRCASTGEPGDGQIQGSPEKVHKADLSDESRPKLLEYPGRLHQGQPEPPHLHSVVGDMLLVGVERYCVDDLDRHGPDVSEQVQLIEDALFRGRSRRWDRVSDR